MKCTDRQYSLISLEEYEREAIDFLKTNEPPEGYYVGFSGGKDSIVTLKLCQMAGVKHQAFYSCTGIDDIEVVRFIKQNYPYLTWIIPKMNFWQGIIKKGPPLRMQRWCCDVLKKDPAKDIPLKMRVMGIRAEESARRASRQRIDQLNKNMTHIKPIFHWKEWQVWEFIEKYNMPYPSLYDQGTSRIGCVICPFIFGPSENKQKKLKENRERHKVMFLKFESCVKIWWNQFRGVCEEKYKNQTFEEFMEDYYYGFEKNTKRIS